MKDKKKLLYLILFLSLSPFSKTDQRQADLQKSIRNPFFNDFRYDLKQ